MTAYVLDELSAEEREQFETELVEHPDGRDAVSEILETVGSLRVGFAAEEAAIGRTQMGAKLIQPTFWQRSGVRAGIVAIAGVAACIAVVLVAVRDSEQAPVTTASVDSEEVDEITIGEFRITIEQPEKAAASAPTVAKAPQPSVVKQDVLPGAESPLLPRKADLPEPEIHFVSTLDPLPPHLRNLRFIDPLDRKVSTFALEVAEGSLGEIQRSLELGRLPTADQIKIEEVINAFHYDYPVSSTNSEVLEVHLEVASCPWQPENRLVRIGLKARETADGSPVALNPAIQVDFNPLRVSGYRLIGEQEPRISDSPGFDHLLVPGHTITALYEIVPIAEAKVINPHPEFPKNSNRMASMPPERRFLIDPELLTVHLRYHTPKGCTLRKVSTKLVDTGADLRNASEDFRFAAAVAAFGEQLNYADSMPNHSFEQTAELAENALGEDPDGRRRAFVDLVRKAGEIH